MSKHEEILLEEPQGNSVYRQILDDIRRGALLPGDRLRETELAERLSVSRTPVREAIRQLETDGLVTHAPRQGATIRSLDYAEVVELYEMRAVLEATAAQLAARVASDIELDELQELNAELSATKDPQEAARLNRIFHATLFDIAKNRFLTKSMQALQKALFILGPTTLSEGSRAQDAVGEHAKVLDALSARDGEAAEAAMRTHIEASQRVRIRTLRDRTRVLDDI